MDDNKDHNKDNTTKICSGKWMVKEYDTKNQPECEWKLILSQIDNSIKGFANFTPENFCKELSQQEKDYIGAFTIEAQASIKDTENDEEVIHFSLTWRSNRKDGTENQVTYMDVRMDKGLQGFKGSWKNYSSGGNCEGRRL